MPVCACPVGHREKQLECRSLSGKQLARTRDKDAHAASPCSQNGVTRSLNSGEEERKWFFGRGSFRPWPLGKGERKREALGRLMKAPLSSFRARMDAAASCSLCP